MVLKVFPPLAHFETFEIRNTLGPNFLIFILKKYSRVQKFMTTCKKNFFLISSIVMSSNLFKIASSYYISLVRCFSNV